MPTTPLDFSTVLAASMHDMKNSLCLLLQSMDNISSRLEHDEKTKTEFAQFHYEIARLNSNLLQLLALYRNCQNSLPLNIEEVYLDELFEELLIKNEMYISNKMLKCTVEIEDDLSWFFDNDLITNLLNDILVNAMRYSKSQLLLKAFKEEQYLKIQIMDDGAGYPEQMLLNTNEQMASVSLSQSRTGLGLYFASLIAKAHNNNGQYGSVNLSNGGRFNGSVFTLTLP
ncbi:sensor histidine kinase [Pseudoalteromonas tunicata]|jgi:K+-sensing histidine kinase KdpD|nr:HAMP domain-containing sensor histidine kinase [Pseudoalteromonas tunicata]ATC94307.1 hypothetical protein PTUN_a1713 [Pseudoalteromonas tunicata]MDP4983124.1 HAMP domain-containing histidine kinase [Pseudoalteromonas tunicata]